MLKVRFGTPEKFVPTSFCDTLRYEETLITYDVSKIKFKTTTRGCLIEMPIEYEEQVYGCGLQLKGFNHKNHKLQLRVNSDPVANTGDSHAPVPFFISTAGYGIYVDTARYAEICFGYGKEKNRPSNPDNTVIVTHEDLYKKCGLKETTTLSIEIPVAKGVDIYIFEGDTITDIVAQYNMFSGGGCDVPEWGLGVMYRNFAKTEEDGVRKTADYFRENDIPCDIMGICTGWQTNTYSCSFVWDETRFPHHQKLIDYLRSKDFHVSLWEHAFVSSAAPFYKEIAPYTGDYEVWKGLIPDFSIEKCVDIFAKYHKEYLVEKGIDGFKLDECDNSDFVHDWSYPNCTEFPSGMDGELYHTLMGTLYMKTIMKAMKDVPTLSESRSAGALCASYPFVLYSDLYDHKDFIRGVVNSGFSGILWCPEVRDAVNKKDFIRRVQTVVFSAQCVINSWYCPEIPWITLDCEQELKKLLHERKKLVPMLKTAFDKYRDTGVAPIRALVSDYTWDKETYNIDNEYIFCDNLIVAPITAEENDTRMVYLPEGNWVDYWTKEPVASGWFRVETTEIPVYEKV